MRARRSLLFVCGAEAAALEAARDSAADTLILDLEDTVTPDRKPRARDLVAESLRRPARAGLERTVRVNPPATSWFAADVAAVVAAGADALVVPKVETPADVRLVARRLERAERASGRPAGAVGLLALVETPLGVLDAHVIAGAHARLAALVIGHVDLSRTLGIKEAGAMAGTILHARCHLVLAAKATGRQAVDAVFMDLADPDGLIAGRLVAPESQHAHMDFLDFRDAMQKLPLDQREALILVGASGMSYEEAAQICGCAPGTMKSRVNRARNRLSDLMSAPPSAEPREWSSAEQLSAATRD